MALSKWERLKTGEALLRECVEAKYYGEVTLKFEAGNIVFARKTESLKIGNGEVGVEESDKAAD